MKILETRPENFMTLTMEEQAKYADPITRKFAQNEEFINKLPVDIQKSIKALITGL